MTAAAQLTLRFPEPAYEYRTGPAYYRAREEREGMRAAGETLTWLLINAVGGPFVQRWPTRAQCRTDKLDYFAELWLKGCRLRGVGVASRLQTLGLTVEQVVAWSHTLEFYQ